jgi:hypothetical protein
MGWGPRDLPTMAGGRWREKVNEIFTGGYVCYSRY